MMVQETTKADLAAVASLVSAVAAFDEAESDDLLELIGGVIGDTPSHRLATAFMIILREALHQLAEAKGEPIDDVWQSIALDLASRFSGDQLDN